MPHTPPEITVIALRFDEFPVRGDKGAPTTAPLELFINLYLKKALTGLVGMVMNSVALPNETFLKSVSLVTREAVEESIRISVKPGDFPVALINLNRVKPLSENDPGLSVKDKRLLVDPVSANMVV